jgi:hypothetical protein
MRIRPPITVESLQSSAAERGYFEASLIQLNLVDNVRFTIFTNISLKQIICVAINRKACKTIFFHLL